MKPSKVIVSALFALALVVVIKIQLAPKAPEEIEPVAKNPSLKAIEASPDPDKPVQREPETTVLKATPEPTLTSAEAAQLAKAGQAMKRAWRKQECQDLQSISQSPEPSPMKNWLTRTGGDIHFAQHLPSYFQYDNETLEAMVAQRNPEAMHILGLKLMFEYLTYSMEQKAVVAELTDNHIHVEMAESLPENEEKLVRGRALLEQAVANGRIFAAKTLAESYDLEMKSMQVLNGETNPEENSDSEDAVKYALLYNDLLPEALSDKAVDIGALHKATTYDESRYEALLSSAREAIAAIQERDGYIEDESMHFPESDYAAMNICDR